MTTETERSQPAPGDLELVRSFVNTNDIEARQDQLTTADGLGVWLAAQGLLVPHEEIGQDAAMQAMCVREALRAMMLANNGNGLDPGAVSTLEKAARDARLVLRFGADGRTHLEPEARGVAGAMGRLLAIVASAMADGTWSRLKACRNHGCWWAFYDRSKNRSATWCTMEVCGNRAKARAFRERQRGMSE